MSSEQSNQPESETSDEEEAVAKLIGFAGIRTDPSEIEMASIKRTALDRWELLLSRRRKRQRVRVLQIAATLLVAMGIGAWQMGLFAPGSAPVGTVELASSRLRMLDGSQSMNIGVGDQILSLRELSTGSEGQAAIRLSSGIGVRLDRGTRIRVLANDRLALDEGRLYIDTSGAPDSEVIEIQTRQGTARDLGTRFALVDVGDGVRIQVREGRVEVRRGTESWQADKGHELVLAEDGSVADTEISVYGNGWEWVLETSPSFALEGSTLGNFLDWVSTESGWSVALAVENEDAVRADRMHGSLEGLTLEESLQVVLSGAGLTSQLENGVLEIRPRGH
jgi:hypothetical protein